MRKLVIKLFLFVLPLVLWGIAIICIDPFNYFNMVNIIPDKTKKNNAMQRNAVLFKSLEYLHNPSPNLIIGDSRAGRLSSEYLSKCTGIKYKALAINAGKINEFTDLFWFANNIVKLKNVYITLNFNIFNSYAFADRIKGVETLINNPFLYIFDRSVAEASFLVVKSEIEKRICIDTKPKMTETQFWDYLVQNQAAKQYSKWQYPQKGFAKLREVANYCHKNNISLVFIVMPSHTDYQKRVSDFKLDREEIRFKRDVAGLATTYDFDFPNELTTNKDNFSDPVHIKNETGNIIIDEIVGKKTLKHCKLLNSPSSSTHNRTQY